MSHPVCPATGWLPSYTAYFPPVGGIRFGIITFPPDPGPKFVEDLDIGAASLSLTTRCPAWRSTWNLPRQGCTPRRPLTSRWFWPERSCLNSMTARR
jgi:hypothetical protein